MNNVLLLGTAPDGVKSVLCTAFYRFYWEREHISRMKRIMGLWESPSPLEGRGAK